MQFGLFFNGPFFLFYTVLSHNKKLRIDFHKSKLDHLNGSSVVRYREKK